MRAAIYTRFSSAQQREASTEDQARNCRRRIELEGWQLVEHFKDEAVSGSTVERPGYQRLLKAASAGAFEVLMVDDLSRLSRDQVEGERSIRSLEFKGIRVIGISDGYDSQSKSRKVQRGVRGLMNELYLDDLRDKTHRGLTGQALKQFWAGGRPYGYRLRQVLDERRRDSYDNPLVIGTRLDIDEAQAVVVREIFQQYASGHSPRAIAARLNDRKVPSPGSTWKGRSVRRGAGWMGSGVRVILRNPLYRGQYIWNVTRWEKNPDTGRRVMRKRPQSEWISSELPELRIVDKALYERVQSRVSEQTHRIGERVSEGMSRSAARRTGPGGKYLLSGALRCADCGAAFVIVAKDMYGCSSHRNGGESLCSNDAMLPRKHTEAQLLAGYKRQMTDPAVIDEISRRVRAALRMPKPKASDGRAAELRAQAEHLADAIASGALRASPTLGAKLAAVEVELRELQRAAAAPKPADVSRLLAELPARVRAAVAELEQTLMAGDILKAQREIRARVGVLKVQADELEIRLYAEPERIEALLLRSAGPSTTTPIGWRSGGRN